MADTRSSFDDIEKHLRGLTVELLSASTCVEVRSERQATGAVTISILAPSGITTLALTRAEASRGLDALYGRREAGSR